MKKLLGRVFAFAFLAAIVFGGISLKADAASYTETKYNGTYYGRVLAQDGLYVYKKPDVTSARVGDGGVSYNWQVQCLSYTSNGFTKIKYYYGKKSNTFTGYVHSRYLSVSKWDDDDDDVPKTTETFTKIYGYTGTVKGCASLNVHSTYKITDTDTKIIGYLKKGAVVNVIAKSDSWYKIQYKKNGDKVVGYVARKFIKVKDALRNNLSLVYPTKVMSSKTKYTLKVKDTTTPYKLSTTIKWSSTKPSVASVSSKGVVKAKKAGTTTIKAKVKCGNETTTLKIKVKVTTKYTMALQ